MRVVLLFLMLCACWCGLAGAEDNLEQTIGQLGQIYNVAGGPGVTEGLFSGFSLWSVVGGLIFSGIGFVAFMYGKKNQEYLMMAIGILLMVYPYFIRDTLWVYVVGAALTAALYFFR